MEVGIFFQWQIALGPLAEKNPVGAHGISFSVAEQYQQLKKMNGTIESERISQGLPSIKTAKQTAEAMMTLSSATNGKVAMMAWEAEEAKTGLSLKDIAEDRAGEHHTFQDITVQPRGVIPTPIFTGSNKGDRRYSPFTTNIERYVPFRTLTGRQHFYLDHEIITESADTFIKIHDPVTPAVLPVKTHGRIAPELNIFGLIMSKPSPASVIPSNGKIRRSIRAAGC